MERAERFAKPGLTSLYALVAKRITGDWRNRSSLQTAEMTLCGGEAYPDEMNTPAKDGDEVYIIVGMDHVG